jgi:hypothetical protein
MGLSWRSLVLGVCLVSVPAMAKLAGISNKSKTGCGSCHGATPSAAVQVTLEGPVEIELGQEVPYVLRIAGGPAVAGGLNVSMEPSDAGTLMPGFQMRALNGQVTHSAPMPGNAGEVVFNFSIKAGDAPATVTLYAAGNSVDATGTNANDAYNVTQRAVTFRAGSPDAGTALALSNEVTPGVTDEPAPLTFPEPFGGGGCSSAVGAAPALALLIPLWGRTRRRRSAKREG